MSRVAKVGVALVVVAGAVVTVIAYWTGRDSTDGQEALVIPFLIFWTAVAVGFVWIDRAIGALRRHLAGPSS